MKKLLVTIVNLLIPLLLFSQSDTTYFSNAIKINFRKYKKETNLAYRQGDFERGKFLFDSLVKHRLAGTIMDNFTLKKVNHKKLKLESFKKPVVLITYASWCVSTPGEIPALNKVAQKYKNDADFIVLFWDKRSNMKKISRKFNRHITVCYAHEYYRNDASLVAALKHTLGFPTVLYLDDRLKVVDIRRCGVQQCPKKTPYKKAYALNFNGFIDGLTTILIDKEIKKEMLAVN